MSGVRCSTLRTIRELTWIGGNMGVGLLLDMVESGLGDRVALGDRASGLTHGDVVATVRGGAAVISGSSPSDGAVGRPPSEVIYLGRNGPGYPQVFFAAAMAGVPFVPVNYRLGDEVLGDLVDDFDHPLIVVEERYRDRVAGRDQVVGLDDFLAAARAAEPMPPIDVPDDAPAVLLHTSGTTSKPKVVPLRHENLQAYVFATVDFAGAGEEEAALITVSPYHVAAVGATLTNFYGGRRVVHLPDFDAGDWLDLVARESISSATVVPTMLARVVDALGGEVAEAPALRLISYGGARLPLPVLERAMRAFPDAGFCNAYGLTETSSTLALLGPDDHARAIASDDPRIRRRLESVGRPIPGMEIEIRDADGKPVGPGETGSLFVRGAQVSGSYLGKGSVLDDEGWFPTNDQAWVDDEGYL
ncbi:class I adenylate-forming enzyme family protein [Gordonia amicalis]|uniref:Class I adenylate-forming enzyme family protein n=1 Tax=Gordonia amicalis TaxID=89053 RepID=A0AAE4R1F3_9ACTN|nr:class I adenylate-forming enzyme family protein [Gordonia amicalis]MCZ0914833.1 class I adenylate-forming enzyme family protein [Gordonia amicalis]MCZ4578630.1 class I adenylate-forming enzyme family protein [Gordonia amicalis]MDV6311469.1 class I adenylate-forming enzyme family protein [Gordonia amicalis]MDV7174820.1 class I adenylate-forming enzyme family protein [Gordonia amicalis]